MQEGGGDTLFPYWKTEKKEQKTPSYPRKRRWAFTKQVQKERLQKRIVGGGPNHIGGARGVQSAGSFKWGAK